MKDVSVIYYTSNMEESTFEGKIRENIRVQSEGLEIISVSRKPLDFGLNVCVGECPVCYSNSYKQLLMGLKLATTDFCIAAESDCLYPREYFTYVPKHDDRVYRYTNVVVHFDGRDKFWRKPWSEGAQMCGREYWIDRLEKAIAKVDSWEPEPFRHVFPKEAPYAWSALTPVITFKTRNGVNFKTGFYPGSFTYVPGWGTAVAVRERYLD